MHFKKITRFAIALVAGGLAVVPVAMGADPGSNRVGQLTISGVTGGTSSGAGGAMDVYLYDISIKNNSTIGSSSSGAGAGKATASQLQVIKHPDQATPKLFNLVASGQRMKDARLEINGAGGASPYLTYCFSDVGVTSDHHYASGANEGDSPQEAVSLNFTRLAVTFNGPLGNDLTQGWDFSRNSKAPAYCPSPVNNTRAHK
jgi:type VI secretion system Hcp family effector